MTDQEILRASASSRWGRCTKSVELSRGIVQEAGEAAAEGTAAHTVLELMWLSMLQRYGHFQGQGWDFKRESLERTIEASREGTFDVAAMEMAAASAVDFGISLMKDDPDSKVWIEKYVTLPRTATNVAGTADAIIWQPTIDSLHIIDFKYGRVEVPAEENTQLLIYLVGALQSVLNASRFPKEMNLIILQPRSPEPIKLWEVSAAYLLEEFYPKLKTALAQIESGNTQFYVGESTCKYCPALAICPKAAEYVQTLCEFDDMDDIDLLKKSLDSLGVVKAWVKAVEAAGTEKLLAGEAIEGWSLEPGKSNRRWTSEADVLYFLQQNVPGLNISDIAPRKLIGIPAVEKLIKSGALPVDRQNLQEYITKPPGKLKLTQEK